MKAKLVPRPAQVKAIVEEEIVQMLDSLCREDIERRSTVIRRLIVTEYRRRHPAEEKKR
jgi:hypothetical protein